MKPSAIITGVTGQDGAYLAQLLLKKKYKVYGIIRRSSSDPLSRLEYLNIKNKINYINLDLSEHLKIIEAIRKIKPKYFFNLAAQSFVTYAYDNPIYTDQINNQSVINILEAIRQFSKKTKFYQASSSEMYGLNERNQKKLNEKSHFNPISPYSIAKLSSYHYVRMYRNSFNMFASNGILFNHESPLRGEQFVTKKIVKALTEIKFNKKKDTLKLGNIYSRRDWGHAKDYVEAQWLMLQQKDPDDFVIATGKQYSVRDFVNEVSKNLDMQIEWSGEGVNEVGSFRGVDIIKIDPRYFRPTEVETLLGDANKAKKILNWSPKISFEELAKEMITKDLELMKNK